jgi:hypothetical protein
MELFVYLALLFLWYVASLSFLIFWTIVLRNVVYLLTTRSKAWTVFSSSNTGVVCSNPTGGMDVCMPLFCVCVILCVGSGLVVGCSLVQGVLPTVYRIKKPKKRQKSKWLEGRREFTFCVTWYATVLHVWSLWTRQWTFRFHKILGSSWVAAQLAASQEGLSSMK